MKSSGKMYLRTLGINALLCITSISIFLGSAEGLARLHYEPQEIKASGSHEYDKDKFYRLKANFHGPNWGAKFSTNSHGFRGKEITAAKPENAVRVLVLGDSVAFGLGVEDNETFPFYLEQALNQHFAELEKNILIEVINTAASGNSPFQEYYDVKRGLRFDPDLIVLQVTLNDILIEPTANWIFGDIGIAEEELGSESLDYLLGKHKLPYYDYLLRQNSAFYLFLKDMNARIRFEDPAGKNIPEKATLKEKDNALLLVKEPENKDIKEAWDYALNQIQKIVDIANENDIPFVLFVAPFSFQPGYYTEYAHPQRRFEQFAAENDIYFADLLATIWQIIVERGGGQKDVNQIITEWYEGSNDILQDLHLELFFDSVHLTATGHKLTADLLTPIVLEALSFQ